jgi:hypothetical protein
METLFGTPPRAQRSWRFWLLVLSPFLVIGTCSVLARRNVGLLRLAEEQGTVFHSHLYKGEYDAIYDAASYAFRGTRDETRRYLAAIHEKTGSCSLPKSADSSLAKFNTSGTTVRLKYSLTCEKGQLDEEMTFLVEDGVPKLTGYRASSPFVR